MGTAKAACTLGFAERTLYTLLVHTRLNSFHSLMKLHVRGRRPHVRLAWLGVRGVPLTCYTYVSTLFIHSAELNLRHSLLHVRLDWLSDCFACNTKASTLHGFVRLCACLAHCTNAPRLFSFTLLIDMCAAKGCMYD